MTSYSQTNVKTYLLEFIHHTLIAIKFCPYLFYFNNQLMTYDNGLSSSIRTGNSLFLPSQDKTIIVRDVSSSRVFTARW